MNKTMIAMMISMATAMGASAQFPSWGGDQNDYAEMQAPQIVMPRQASPVDEAPELDFTKPVTFSWMPCTNPSGAPVRVSYTLYIWRLLGQDPYTAVEELEPMMVISDLNAPQFTYNKPLSERIGYFVQGEPYAFVVKATVQSLNGQAPPAVANGGASGYSVFIVNDELQITNYESTPDDAEPSGNQSAD